MLTGLLIEIRSDAPENQYIGEQKNMLSLTLRKHVRNDYAGSLQSKEWGLAPIFHLTQKLCRNSLPVLVNLCIERQVSPIDC